jgi:hypothetical protein
MRVKEEQRKPLEEGRLLLLSPFSAKDSRVTADTALIRNRFVAALSDDIFVSHAAPEGKTEKFCLDILTWGKTATTLDSPLNEKLIRSWLACCARSLKTFLDSLGFQAVFLPLTLHKGWYSIRYRIIATGFRPVRISDSVRKGAERAACRGSC